jgi:hypothetical protein
MTANEAVYSTGPPAGETLIVDGHNVAVRVRNGCLDIVDGVHPYCRTRTITRADRSIRRVIVLGAGVVTTEAMLWCHARNLALVVARTATPTMVNAVTLFDHAGLRRAQALAPYVKGSDGRSVGLGVARWLIDQRLQDQARPHDDRSRLGQVCGLARLLQPSVVILEDVDVIAPDRSFGPLGVNPILYEVLNQIDGLGDDVDVTFLLATNRVDILERAPVGAARPGGRRRRDCAP